MLTRIMHNEMGFFLDLFYFLLSVSTGNKVSSLNNQKICSAIRNGITRSHLKYNS